ncbi:hypothetical protein ACIPJ1_00430 [Microbacterium maritypicum]|uniref:hypothetical protein n=1 Tax=Microbacterium maritypicum TaxID=33918 RepID=UPI0038197E8F
MDVFERVREVNRGAGLNDERITEARARLLTGIDADTSAERRRTTRRPMFVIAGAMAGVAAATAGVVLISQMDAPSPQVEAVPQETALPTPRSTPAPKPSTTSGTTVTEPFPGTTPQTGQHLRIVNTTESIVYRDDQSVFAAWGESGLRGRQPVSALMFREVSEVNMPADRTTEWSGRFDGEERVAYFPGNPGPDGVAAWDALLPPAQGGREWTSAGGFEGDASPRRGSAEWSAAFPRDPYALLEFARTYMRAYEQTPAQANEAAVSTLVDVLRSNVAPADLRQSVLHALDLAGVPASTANGIETYRIRYEHIDRRTDTVSIDTATGWATEYTLRSDRVDAGPGDMVPQTVPDIRMTYSVSIVDSAP